MTKKKTTSNSTRKAIAERYKKKNAKYKIRRITLRIWDGDSQKFERLAQKSRDRIKAEKDGENE